MTITAHFLNEQLILQNFNLETKHFPHKHTAINICRTLQLCFEEYGISNEIASITTDNGANVVAAVNNGGWVHYSCYAHTLNLVVTESLREFEDSTKNTIMKKCRDVVHLFKSSTTNSNLLKKAQEDKGNYSVFVPLYYT